VKREEEGGEVIGGDSYLVPRYVSSELEQGRVTEEKEEPGLGQSPSQGKGRQVGKAHPKKSGKIKNEACSRSRGPQKELVQRPLEVVFWRSPGTFHQQTDGGGGQGRGDQGRSDAKEDRTNINRGQGGTANGSEGYETIKGGNAERRSREAEGVTKRPENLPSGSKLGWGPRN